VEGNVCFINELEVLNQPPFVWPLATNRGIVGAGAFFFFFKEFMVGKMPHCPSGLRG
jgi:hypothetical protein